MYFQSVRWVVPMVAALAVMACGGSDDGSLGSGGSAGASGAGATGGSAGGGAGGTGGSAGAGTGGSAGAGTGGSAGGACTAIDVTYNLDGSTFRVGNTPLGAGNQTNTCEAPYTENDQIGPGTMVIRFADGGAAGPAWIVSYVMDLAFTVSAVQTRLDTEALPASGQCSVAAGTFNAGTLTFSPAVMHNYHTFGDVLCTGSLCSFGGLPNGTPVAQDDTGDQALNAFTFTSGVSSFTMPEVLVSQDNQSATYLALVGTEVSRADACACP